MVPSCLRKSIFLKVGGKSVVFFLTGCGYFRVRLHLILFLLVSYKLYLGVCQAGHWYHHLRQILHRIQIHTLSLLEQVASGCKFKQNHSCVFLDYRLQLLLSLGPCRAMHNSFEDHVLFLVLHIWMGLTLFFH